MAKVSTTESMAPVEMSPGQVPSVEEIERLWQERRAEAIIAIADLAIKDAPYPKEVCDAVAGLAADLARLARVFGEPSLGERAGSFHHALRTRADWREVRALAQEFLDSV